MNITPLTRNSSGYFAGDVTGIDLTRPLTSQQVAAIESGLDRFAVLVFHDQRFDDDTHLAFSRNFGELEISAAGGMTKPEERRLKLEPADISNLDRDNRMRTADDRLRFYTLENGCGTPTHPFAPSPPSIRYCPLPGTGGNTDFADMCAAYDALDDATKADIENLATEHSNVHSREMIGFPKTAFGDRNQEKLRPVRQRLIRTHPVTQQKSLYLSAHIGTIVGWPLPEARAFIRDLTERVTQRQFVFAHVWRPWDLVVWDNRTTMHRARRYNDLRDIRDLRRSTVRGDAVTAAQQKAA